METIGYGIIDILDTIPCPIKNWFVPKHQQSASDAKYNKNNKCQHTKEAERADKSSGEGKLHPHENSSLYSRIRPAEEPYKAIFIC